MKRDLLNRVIQKIRHYIHPVPVPKRITGDNSIRKALLFYIKDSSDLDTDNPNLTGHTNRWESREFVQVLLENKYSVDVYDWCDVPKKLPSPSYDLVFDIHYRLSHYSRYIRNDGIAWLHMTGSYPEFQNAMEKKRCLEFERRHGVCYPLIRKVEASSFKKALNKADLLTLIGNSTTRDTYPFKIASHINLINVTHSICRRKESSELLSTSRDILFFSGGGALLKGLDLAIEAVLTFPEMIKLHIVGPFDEPVFWHVYEGNRKFPERIQYHGYLSLDSPQFQSIIKSCQYVLSPTCSEGMSSSGITAMHIGLYPIFSRNTGIDIQDNFGTTIPELTVDSVSNAIYSAIHLGKESKNAVIKENWKRIDRDHSRFAFSKRVREIFDIKLRGRYGS